MWRIVGLWRSTRRYRVQRIEPEGLRAAIRDVAYEHSRAGYRFVHWFALQHGFAVGLREGLSVRKRRRRKLRSAVRFPKVEPQRPNERWSLDFVHDQLANGHSIRVLNVVDDFTRESVVLEVSPSIPASVVTFALDRAIASRRTPKALVCDNGTEFRSRIFQQWTARHGIEIQFIDPGKPTENAFVESFNGRLRDECLNTHWFVNLAAARHLIGQWRDHYNHRRPHSALGYVPPATYALTHQTQPTE